MNRLHLRNPFTLGAEAQRAAPIPRCNIVRIVVLLAVIVGVGLLYQYRFLILSRLNIPLGTGESEQALGLKRIKDIPLPGNPTRFDSMSIDPDRRLLFIARHSDGRIDDFSLPRQLVVGQVAGIDQVNGVLAVPELRKVFATSAAMSQLVSIDSASLKVVSRTDAGDYPDTIAYVPDLGKLFVSDQGGGVVTVIEASTGRWQSAIDLGGTVGNTVFDPFSRRVYSAAQARNQIFEIDPRSNTVLRKIDLMGCGRPRGLYVDGLARIAFIGCADNAQLAILDLDSAKITGLRSVGESPDVLAFDEVLRRLYVGAESGFVTVFQERGKNLEPRGGAYLAPNAHTLAVDSVTHRIYMPLENVDGHPVLRVLAPLDVPSRD